MSEITVQGEAKPDLLRFVKNHIRDYALLISLLAIMIFFQFTTNGTLFMPVNMTNIILQNSYIVIMALGMLLIIVAGHIDLSVGSVSGFIGAVAAVMMVSWKLDPLLLRVSGGRLATTLVFPTAVLETTGVKSGKQRRNAIIYFHDAGVVVVVASNAGSPRHPGWYHNLLANPEVTLGGIPMHATVVKDEDRRRRLWELADRVFPAFATYRRDAARTDRQIPLVQLTPRGVAEPLP